MKCDLERIGCFKRLTFIVQMGTNADNKQSGLAGDLLHNKEKRPADRERSHCLLDDNESCYK